MNDLGIIIIASGISFFLVVGGIAILVMAIKTKGDE
jgi:hypothetical protein